MVDDGCMMGVWHCGRGAMIYKALALDSDSWLRKDVQKAADLELSSFGSPEQFLKSMQTTTPDIVLLHFPLPAGPAHELISRLRTLSIPIILIIEGRFPDDEALHDPLVDFVRSPVNAYELKARVHKLHSFWASQVSAKQTIQQPITRVKLLSAPELRNEGTGRLDASRIANFFGLSLNEFARILGRPHTSVHKTPDSESLQESLYPCERVVSAAKHILGDENATRTFKIWLNSKAKPLGNTPIAVIKAGKIEMLADWLEDAVLGLPE
jgi:CheY-like chemotaxis protein